MGFSYKENAVGFSLKMFFDGLQSIVNDPDMDDAAKVQALAAYLEREREYAQECGQLSA
jgi:ubiquitin-protein ligase